MAIVKMKKLMLVALKADQEAIVRMLHRMASVEIIDLEEQLSQGNNGAERQRYIQGELSRLDERISKVKYALDFINRYRPEKKGMFSAKPLARASDYQAAVDKEAELMAVYETCRHFEEQLADIKGERTRIKNLMDELEPWLPLKMDFQDIKDTPHVEFKLGTMPLQSVADFTKATQDEGVDCYIYQVSADRNIAYLLIAYHKGDREKAVQLLRQHEWNEADLSAFSKKPAEHMLDLKRQWDALQRSEDEIAEQIRGLVKYKPLLQLLSDYLNIQRQRVEVLADFADTKETFALRGWIPAEKVEELERKLSHITDAYVLHAEDPAGGEPFPVAFKNNKWLRPFEMITEMYSMPDPYSADPTPVLAPFYFIFFGMMVGDAAYGIIISVAFFAAMRLMRTKGMGQKMIMLLAFCGISTIFWGAMFGSWFGDLLRIKPLWFNPMDKPMLMMIVSLIFGLAHVLVGLGVKAYMSIRDGHIWDAIFDEGFWAMVLVGASMALIPSVSEMMLGEPASAQSTVAGTGKYLAIAGALGLIITQGRHQKNPLMKAVSGVGSLYNITGFLSDILSYSRLFALGMASGMIATVINILAGLVGMHGINLIASIPILIIGHVFNLAINGLGAYVHASRLQYIEFFGKFFESGGKAFRPFYIETKYTDIEDEEAV